MQTEALISVTVPGYQSVTYMIPAGNQTAREITFSPGVTNIYEENVADFILDHPQTELFDSLNLVRITDVRTGKEGELFEQVDGKTGDGMPVGDLPDSSKAKRTKTQYRGAGGDKKATEVAVSKRKKTTETKSTAPKT